MIKLKNTLSAENIVVGYLYFYIHLVVELACFYILAKQIGDSVYLWIFPLMYDALAFVPQSIFGYLSDKYPKVKMGLIGFVLMTLSIFAFWFNLFSTNYISLIFLCFGNALLHINGAEVTLRCSKGKLSHSAIFVSGGSFGVIFGRLLGKTFCPYWVIILLLCTMVPFILLAEYYREDSGENSCQKFNYSSTKLPGGTIILLAVLIVIVRGYMGYGIPTSWNKTIAQTIILYFSMGIGKALGGIISDTIGIRKTAIISTTFALPFLLFGNKIMLVSLVGVMFFSMTMAITLALLVSVLKNTPGLAFGLTTIGLFLGTVPIFFVRFTTLFSNSLIIIILSIFCLIALSFIIGKDEIINE